MATQTSSHPTLVHPVFSDLLKLINTIQPPVCSTIDGGACALRFSCDGCKDTYLLEKMKGDVIHIQKSLHSLSMFEQKLGDRMYPLKSKVNESGILAEPRFKELVSAVTQLKFQLPYTSYYEFLPEVDHPFQIPPHAGDAGNSVSDDALLRSNYEALEPNQKKCLWCFSVFPENDEIKKRVLINWWIGEGLLPQESSMPSVEKGEEVLKLLETKGFIQQVEKKRRKSDRWRMWASARSLLKSEEHTLQVNEKLILLHNCSSLDDPSQANKVKTVFNVDKPLIGVNEAEMLAAMKDLEVLHLGRSQVRGLKSIMERLQQKKQLRLLSLAGILSVRELPNSVCRLTSLQILDLRACQALQRLPSGMGRLRSLTHLDVSGCHILRQMPDQLSSLTCLEVLKGFVVGPNSLGGLGKLQNLHKLSLLVSSKDFPTHQDLHHLAEIERLVTLKIVWKPAATETVKEPSSAAARTRTGAFTCCLFANQALVEEGNATDFAHLIKLQKLDLWFPPEEKAESLLDHNNFPRLNKLYIRGANFDHLDYRHNNNAATWDKIEILRLLSLPQLKMTWADMNDLFPELSYLELQDCNNIQFPQCDHEGVWTKHNP